MNTPPIAVLGAGSWGTALAILLAHAGRQVTLWARNEAQLTAMASSRSNERFLPGISFPESLSLAASTDLSSIAHYAHYLLVVPSHAFRETLEKLHSVRADSNVSLAPESLIWGTKGFDPNSGDLLGDVAHEVFGEHVTRALITGPSFARETAVGLPTALVLACEQTDEAEKLAQWFRSPSTRVYPNTDLVGAQIGGAVKNVMAVAAGISDGLGFGANARAALITRGLAELSRLGAKLGGKTETFMGLAGMGDLILTCTDDQSRNRRLGLGIGRGESIQQVVKAIGQEVEGYQTTRELYHRAKALGVSMPITDQVYAVLHQGQDPKLAVRQLLERQPKAEG
ncbi:MAG: NAD(P)-dependent glycerol-3-phosphate dehydrogenase [Proteobacteria bacterium]|nr:NAD(P)-dependent glycerol-3-phosphate dehydrogenase [Pseudomonadota bacterium]